MVGMNRSTSNTKIQLDSVVDVILPGIGLLLLTALGNQFFLLLQHFVSETSVFRLTLIGGIAILVGLVGRKMRRGQHNLPQLIRVVEVGILALLTYVLGSTDTLMLYGISLVILLVLYQFGYQMAHWSEELLFDFERLQTKGGWQDGWSGREGLRLYNRHSVGYKGLIRLMMTVNGMVVLTWMIGRQIQFGMILGGGMIFFFQALFLGVAYYQKQRIVWVIQGYSMQPGMVKRMIGVLLVLSLLVTTVGVLLPVHYNPIPWQAIGDLLNRLFDDDQFTPQTQLDTGQDQPENVEPKSTGERPVGSVGQPSWHAYLFIILFWVMVVVILGVIAGFVLSLLSEEAFRLQGFGGILVRMYLFFKEIIQAWLTGIRRGTKGLAQKWQVARERKERERLENLLNVEEGTETSQWNPTNPREEVVGLFAQMMKKLAKQGVVKGSSQTLTEYIQMAYLEFPQIQGTLLRMHQLLEWAIYSTHEIGVKELNQMREAAQIVQEKI